MRKFVLKSLASAALALAAATVAGAAGPPPPPPPPTPCTGTITGAQPRGDMTVPKGASCTMNNVIIYGNVWVQDNAILTVNGALIEGNVQGYNCHGLILSDNLGPPVFPVDIGGDVSIQNCNNTTARNLGINVDPGTGFVAGNFQCQNNNGNLTCVANQVVIGRDVQVNNNTFSTGVQVTNNTIGRDAEVNNNTSTSSATITGNVILHDLSCRHNQPSPTVSGDAVLGTTQCP